MSSVIGLGATVTRDSKKVVLEWLPGVVAGLMPLAVFLLVKSQLILPEDKAVAVADHAFRDGLNEHLVVFSIVTSAVSTFTAFPRLFVASQEDESPIGPASLSYVMMITLILVFSVAVYVLQEAAVTDNSYLPGGLLLGATLLISLLMEFAIANLRLRHALGGGNASGG